jgi:hypothetical protein
MNHRLRFTCRADHRDPDEGWRDWVEWERRAGVQEFAAHIEELLDEEPDFWDSEWCTNLAAAKLELPFLFREALFQPRWMWARARSSSPMGRAGDLPAPARR